MGIKVLCLFKTNVPRGPRTESTRLLEDRKVKQTLLANRGLVSQDEGGLRGYFHCWP